MPRTYVDQWSRSVFVPCWLMVAIFAVGGWGAGWFSSPERRRFSLRELVVVMTLTAATLGLGVIAGRIDLQQQPAEAATP